MNKLVWNLKGHSVLKICGWIFVLVCAYRSIFPRIDVSRVCWFDSPINYIVYGRAAATVAEVA